MEAALVLAKPCNESPPSLETRAAFSSAVFTGHREKACLLVAPSRNPGGRSASAAHFRAASAVVSVRILAFFGVRGACSRLAVPQEINVHAIDLRQKAASTSSGCTASLRLCASPLEQMLANECRNVCGETGSVRPARNAARFTSCRTPIDVQMMPANLVRPWVLREVRRGEKPEPVPIPVGVDVFGRERFRQKDLFGFLRLAAVIVSLWTSSPT